MLNKSQDQSRIESCLANRLRPWRLRLKGELGAFRDDVRGAMAITLGLFMVLLLGMAVLALDVGRMVVVKTQLQHAADAAALAAAVQLTGETGSRVLADTVARNAAQQTSSFLGGSTTLTVQTGTAGVQFYRNWASGSPGSGDLANDDSDAVIVSVTMNTQTQALILQPILDVMTGTVGGSTTIHSAYAVAEVSNVGCEVPPLLMCNPYEITSPVCGGHTANFYDISNIGRQFIIKAGTGGVPGAPGQFGLLALPDGTSGAGDLGAALASTSQPDCQGPFVTTAPGNKVNQIVWGFQGRFGTSPKSGYNDPAPDISPYPRDSNVLTADVGYGDWNPVSDADASLMDLTEIRADPDYTSDPFTTSEPVQAVHSPTRYQTYLYSIGVEFRMNGVAVIYPPLADPADEVDIGGSWSTVNAGGTVTTRSGGSPDVGAPTLVATPSSGSSLTGLSDEENWVKRRVVKSAVLDCVCLGVAGAGTFGPYGHWIEFFLTEEPTQSGSGNNKTTNVYGEYIGSLSAGLGSPQDIVKNVKLIE